MSRAKGLFLIWVYRGAEPVLAAQFRPCEDDAA